MSDIFISYKSSDRERVRPLVELLERQGLSVWWDQSIHAGSKFDDEIVKAIDAAKCLIVAWSRESVTSEWVREEALEGLRRGMLVPVLIDEVEIPFGFRRVQAARLMDWDGEGGHEELSELFRSVEKKLSRKVQPPPPPPPPRPNTDRAKKWIAAGAITAGLILAALLIRQVFRTTQPPPTHPTPAATTSNVNSAAAETPVNSHDPDDPQKNKWGGKAVSNGRRLRADVRPDPRDPEWFNVAIYVESVDPNKPPLDGDVIFHLHHTFKTPQLVPVRGGRAELYLRSSGAFTVGAVADDGGTRLELDMAQLEGAPSLFRSR